MPRTTIRLLAGIGLVLLSAAGCTSGGDEQPTTSTSAHPTFGTVIDLKPTLPELTVGPSLWGSDDQTVDNLVGIDFHGSSAILWGADKSGAGPFISVVDAASGKPVWTIGPSDQLPGGGGGTLSGLLFSAVGISGNGEDFSVIVEYAFDECLSAEVQCPPQPEKTAERGIAALSGADGTVVWKTPTIPSTPITDEAPEQEDELTTSVIDADSSTVLALVRPLATDAGADEFTTIALDASTGSRKWSTTGYLPRSLDGGVVLAVAATAATPSTASPEAGSVAALDASTGEQVWTLEDRPYESDYQLASNDAAIIDARTSTQTTTILVDLFDGTEIVSLPVRPDRCTASPDAIACTVDTADPEQFRLVFYQDGTLTTSTKTIKSPYLGKTSNGYVTVNDELDESEGITVDSAANVLSDELPGPVVAFTSEFIVLGAAEDTTGDNSYSVHRVD